MRNNCDKFLVYSFILRWPIHQGAFSVGNAEDLRRGVLNFAAYRRGISVFRVQQQEMKSTYGITLACTFIPAGGGISLTT